jgi:hypothetical protein
VHTLWPRETLGWKVDEREHSHLAQEALVVEHFARFGRRLCGCGDTQGAVSRNVVEERMARPDQKMGASHPSASSEPGRLKTPTTDSLGSEI